MKYAGFVNGSNTLASTTADCERTVNWYKEIIDPGTGPEDAKAYLAPTPGIEPFIALAQGPVRALFAQDGRVFAVGGAGFFEMFASHTAIYWGVVANDSRPASIFSNGSAGHQIGIVSGGYGYTFDLLTNTLSQITDSEFPLPCTMGAFVDGYMIALKGRSNEFSWSALDDFTDWDGLDFAQLSQSSDFIQSITAVHGQLYILGSKTSVVWADTGQSSAFEPIPGSLGMQGSIAPWSAAVLDNTLYWLGGNEQGSGVVYRMDGYSPKRVSTHAVEDKIQSYGRITDAIGYAFQQQGHAFYCLYIPSAPVQWWYDAATGDWLERMSWDSTALKEVPWVGRCHTFAFGQHFIGDRQSGAIYRMDPSIAESLYVIPGTP